MSSPQASDALQTAQNTTLAKMEASQIKTLEFQAAMTTNNNAFSVAIEGMKAAKNAANKLQG